MKSIIRMLKTAGMALVVALLLGTYCAACTISLASSKTSIPRDNTTTATLTAHVIDVSAGGDPVPGKIVTFTISDSQKAVLTVVSGTTDASGNASATVKSKAIGSQDQPITVTATCADAGSPATCNVTLNGISISLSLSVDKLYIASVVAPNTSVLTCEIKDTKGNPVQGSVVFRSDNGGVLTPTNGVVTLNGISKECTAILGVGSGTTASDPATPSYVTATFGTPDTGQVFAQAEIKFAQQTSWGAANTVFVTNRVAQAYITIYDQFGVGFPGARVETSWVFPAPDAVTRYGTTDANGLTSDTYTGTADITGKFHLKSFVPNSDPIQYVIIPTPFDVQFKANATPQQTQAILLWILGNWTANGPSWFGRTNLLNQPPYVYLGK